MPLEDMGRLILEKRNERGLGIRAAAREVGISHATLARVAPLDPPVLAQHLGITIWTAAEIPRINPKDVQHLTVVARESWSAGTLRNGNASLIIINNGHAVTRQNNSLAHEIGHIVLRH